jgi:DNA primase
MPPRYRRPVTAAEKARREQASADKLTALHGQLAEQVAALRTGEDWRRWLEVAGRFHRYSFNNTLLIAGQRPDATTVAGYEAWKAMGRQVTKGEKGLQILAPIVRRARAEPGAGGEQAASTEPAASANGPTAGAAAGAAPSGAASGTKGEEDGAGLARAEHLAGFRLAYVWDVSQTTGEPLPIPPTPRLLAGQAPAGLWDALAAVAVERGFAVERGDCGSANGRTDYLARTVRVRPDVDDAQAVRTLAHEVGHVLLHDPSDFPATPGASTTPGTVGIPRTTATAGTSTIPTATTNPAVTTADCRGVREVEAESVAYLVTAVHGLPAADYTFPYVTGWASEVDRAEPERVVRETGTRVLAASRTVLALTQPEHLPTAAAEELTAGAQLGTERTTAAREHAGATLALAQAPSAEPAPTADVEALVRCHADAAAFYAAQLAGDGPDAARAAALLATRAVPAAAVPGHQLGYAPPGWTALTDHLRAHGYTDTQLLDAGVGLRTRRGSVVDRFRDRLMFPVRDPGGQRIVGFLGRALTEGDDIPKYLNSPTTALYRKGELLYGLGAEPTRQALAAGARPVLVEGPLDAIAVTGAGAGRYAGVAPCGTALTAAQVAALDTCAGPLAERGVLVAFDNDRGGRQAALRAYELLRPTGAWPTSASLPDGLDPAALAQQRSPEALRAALDTAGPLANLVVDDRLTRWADRLHWAEGRVGAARDAAAVIATLPPEQVGRQVLRVAERVGLDHAEVTRAVTDAVSRDGDAVGRVARRDLRGDLDRGWESPPPGSAVQLARASYPRRPSELPVATGLTADDARRPPLTQHQAAGMRR